MLNANISRTVVADVSTKIRLHTLRKFVVTRLAAVTLTIPPESRNQGTLFLELRRLDLIPCTSASRRRHHRERRQLPITLLLYLLYDHSTSAPPVRLLPRGATGEACGPLAEVLQPVLRVPIAGHLGHTCHQRMTPVITMAQAPTHMKAAPAGWTDRSQPVTLELTLDPRVLNW